MMGKLGCKDVQRSAYGYSVNYKTRIISLNSLAFSLVFFHPVHTAHEEIQINDKRLINSTLSHLLFSFL